MIDRLVRVFDRAMEVVDQVWLCRFRHDWWCLPKTPKANTQFCFCDRCGKRAYL